MLKASTDNAFQEVCYRGEQRNSGKLKSQDAFFFFCKLVGMVQEKVKKKMTMQEKEERIAGMHPGVDKRGNMQCTSRETGFT